jgi:hypothetical protein
LLAVLFVLPGAWAQTLQVSSETVLPGEWVTLQVRFQSMPQREVAALQWEVEIPPDVFDPKGPQPVARSPLPVKEAGKDATCGMIKKGADSFVWPCLIAGNQKPVPSGIIVVLSFKIPEGTHAGMSRIRLRRAIAVTGDLKQFPVDPAEATLTIRSR